jgi:hypothetical protein
MDSRIKRTAIAVAVAAALALPGAAFAQTDKEKELEARVAELEKLVQEMMAAKAAAPAPAPAAAPAPAPAPTVSTANKGSLTIKGFMIASLYAQDANFAFGNGQNAEFATSEFSTDKWTLGGDVRNTRLTLDWKGPEVEGFGVGGLLEADFFGGLAGGGFTDEQPLPRLRLAYVDVIKGATTFRIGQMWSPMFGNVAASPTHVAFPLGYGAAGDVGWRYPGLFVYHNVNDMTKLTFAAMRGSWNDGAVPFGNGAGEAGTPQFEARVDFSGKNAAGGAWGLYLVGHYDQKDCNLAGDTATANVCGTGYTSKSLDGTAVELGAKYSQGAFSLQGNAYQGTAIGQQFGHITQFGDISGWGGWVQAGFKFNPKWSGYVFYGLDDPKDSDVLASGNSRLKNEQIALSTMYSTGPYVFGIEWLRNKLTTSSTDVTANQISFSGWYKF